jgi:hypothetical protein
VPGASIPNTQRTSGAGDGQYVGPPLRPGDIRYPLPLEQGTLAANGTAVLAALGEFLAERWILGPSDPKAHPPAGTAL